MRLDIKQEAKAIIKAARDAGAKQFGEMILQSILGTVVPWVMNMILAYKQQRHSLRGKSIRGLSIHRTIS